MTAVYGLKFNVIGDSGVGKSQLLRSFTKKPFNEQHMPTQGLEFGTREINFERCVVKSQIWDTAGQDRPEKMSRHFYRDTLGAILVFDITNAKSFNHLKSIWLPQIRKYGHENIPCIIVGNKTDLESQREVESKEAISLAREFKMDYIETSALNGNSVEIAFRRIVLHVASLLPAVRTHLEVTNLPEGWITGSGQPGAEPVSAIDPRAVSMDINNNIGKVSDGTEVAPQISASLPTSKMMHPQHQRRSITSLSQQARKSGDNSNNSSNNNSSSNMDGSTPQVTPTPSAAVSISSYVNYWTGEECKERPTAPAPIPLLFDTLVEEKRIEMEARASERASISESNRTKSTAGNSTSSNSSIGHSYSSAAMVAAQSKNAADRPIKSAKSVDIQYRDSTARSGGGSGGKSSSTSHCFCLVM